jgi:hypothetical protein
MSDVNEATPQSQLRAEIEHRIPGRLRLRIRAKRGDDAFFRRIEAELAATPGVISVRGNARTGGILLEYGGDEAAVLAAARVHGLWVAEPPHQFVAARPVPAWPAPTGPLPSALDMAALGLLGAALVQLVRGEVVGSASENFWNAYGLYAVTRRTMPSALLVAFGLLQVARGEVFGSATSLLLYAYSAWRMAQQQPATAATVPGSAAG